MHDVQDLLLKHKESIQLALKPQNDSATITEEAANILRARCASDLGAEWLRLLEESDKAELRM